MDFKDGLPFYQVGKLHMDLPVEASGTHKRTVEYVGTVSGSEDDNTCVAGKSIHLGKQLVEGVLPFVVGAGHGIFAPCAAYGVDLINKYDTGCFFLCLFKEVAHP